MSKRAACVSIIISLNHCSHNRLPSNNLYYIFYHYTQPETPTTVHTDVQPAHPLKIQPHVSGKLLDRNNIRVGNPSSMLKTDIYIYIYENRQHILLSLDVSYD